MKRSARNLWDSVHMLFFWIIENPLLSRAASLRRLTEGTQHFHCHTDARVPIWEKDLYRSLYPHLADSLRV